MCLKPSSELLLPFHGFPNVQRVVT
uniref:Uncharacterized protein n=1 Tax=Arundo donax TaxID=35708 RepID=A0A0A9GUE4_ARUDO